MHENYLLDRIKFLKEKTEELEKKIQVLENYNKTMEERSFDYGWNNLRVCTCDDILKPRSSGTFFKKSSS